MSGTTSNQRLKEWVDEWAAILQPDAIHWCDGSAEEYDRLCQRAGRLRHVHQLDEAKRPNSYWAHSDPADVARVEDRTFICSATAERRRPEQQLARSRRDARRDDRALHRRHAGPHDVRRAVLDGPARLAASPTSACSSPTPPTSPRQHADHDPHGPGRPRRARATASGCRACTRSAPRSSRARPTCRGRATPTTSTSSTSPRPARSGPTARATAATPCSARSASPCASPR